MRSKRIWWSKIRARWMRKMGESKSKARVPNERDVKTTELKAFGKERT